MSGSYSGGPQPKKIKLDKKADKNGNSPRQLILQVVATASQKPTRNLNNGKSQTAVNVKKKLPGCKITVQQLTKKLCKQKENFVKDKAAFTVALSNLQTFNSGNQRDLGRRGISHA